MEYVFLAGAMHTISAGDGGCPSYYKYNAQFDNLSSSHCRISAKILESLKCSGLYTFALHMGTHPVVTALTICYYTEID